jgi:hypothetical protein
MIITADVDIESMMLWQGEGGSAQVPLSDMPGRVSRFTERLGQGEFFEGKGPEKPSFSHLVFLGAPPARREPLSQEKSSGILSGEDRGTGRRTDRTGRIRVGKT